ncbi:HD domain-containing protein [Dellaglioa sp. P0083]|uniref:HD domain-containing protein n=1 Tax=Dellaglioa kimchii TaxID=3344667 RepID=UPI0038D401CE
MLPEEQIQAVKIYTQNKLASDTSGHDFAHIERVVTNSKTIASEIHNINYLIIVLSSYLHDVIDDKVVDNVKEEVTNLTNFLTSIDLNEVQINDILTIIKSISFKNQLNDNTINLSEEAKVVQDADRLDAIGAVGIARTFYYGGHVGSKIYDPHRGPRRNMTPEEYRNIENQTVINHFYEKLLTLTETMNTEPGKRMAKNRHQIMLDFLENFKSEWEGKS